LRRKLLLSIAGAALIAALVIGALILLDTGESAFAKDATPILEPVEKTTGELGDSLRTTEASADLPTLGHTAAQLEAAAGKALIEVRGLQPADHRHALVVDFLQATRAYARAVGDAKVKLTFATASAAEEAGRKGRSSRDELESSDAGVPVPAGDDFAAAERLSVLAKRCGGVPPGSVALVGDRPITRIELDRLLDQARVSLEDQGSTFPRQSSYKYRVLVRQAMDFAVRRVEFAEEARKLGVVVSAKDVDERLQRIKRQYFGRNEQGYQQQLERTHLTDEQVHRDVRHLLIRERVLGSVARRGGNGKRGVQAWKKAMRETYARRTLYRVGFQPEGAKGAPEC